MKRYEDDVQILDELTGDVRSIAALAAAVQSPDVTHPSEFGAVQRYYVPEGYELKELDLARLMPHPRRATGNTTLTTQRAFVTYVNRFKSPETLIYANSGTSGTDPLVKAIFNDHSEARDNGQQAPGWRDFTATFSPKRSQAWCDWLEFTSRPQTQETFAYFLEGHIAQVSSIEDADIQSKLLTVALDFKVKKDVTYEKAQNLANGQVQLRYVETVSALDARGAVMEVPEQFHLQLAPFEGGPEIQVPVRLRYRVNDGKCVISVEIGAEAMARFEVAFEDMCKEVAEATGIEVLQAVIPA